MPDAPPPAAPARKRVLLIDDMPTASGITHDVFVAHGWECVVCTSSEEATHVLSREGSFDLIVSDLNRPRADDDPSGGFNAGLRYYLNTIRAYAPRTPVIFYSRYGTPETVKAIEALPFCVFASRLTTTPKSLLEIANALPRRFAKDGPVSEELFQAKELLLSQVCAPILVDTRREVIKYFARHPEKMTQMSSREFEHLVTDILRELGFDAETTKATRDGGVDIYAHFRNQVCGFLMIVECKRWSPERHVGIAVVQRLYGIQQTQQANKALIVTTSFFTEPAREETRSYPHLMELKDYNDLRHWLAPFR